MLHEDNGPHLENCPARFFSFAMIRMEFMFAEDNGHDTSETKN